MQFRRTPKTITMDLTLATAIVDACVHAAIDKSKLDRKQYYQRWEDIGGFGFVSIFADMLASKRGSSAFFVVALIENEDIHNYLKANLRSYLVDRVGYDPHYKAYKLRIRNK